MPDAGRVRPAVAVETAPGRLRALYALLAGLALVLALVRLLTGPWLHLYNPAWGTLLEGQPVEWEVVYYLQQFPTLIGDGPPLDGFAPVHQRALVELYIATALYGWSGSAYWSLAAVDLVGWAVAGIATYHVGLRLGLARWPAALGAVLVITSPLFVSNMWMHVFHPAEFASLPVGLWAVLAIVQGDRRAVRSDGSERPDRGSAPGQRSGPAPGVDPGAGHFGAGALAGPWFARWLAVGRLALALGLVLFGLNVTYQYQWIVLPVLGVLALTWPARSSEGRSTGRRDRVSLLAAVAGSVAVLGAAMLLMSWLIAAAGLPTGGSLDAAVSRPEALAVSRLARLSTEGLAPFLPHLSNLEAMVEVYHPIVFVAGCLGLLLLPWRVGVMALAATGAALLAHVGYATSWMAMAAYPFIYLGAGALCARAGAFAGAFAGVIAGAFAGVFAGGAVGRPPGQPHPASRRQVLVAGATAVLLLVVLAGITNADLWGDTRFVHLWWSNYALVPRY